MTNLKKTFAWGWGGSSVDAMLTIQAQCLEFGFVTLA